MSTKFPGFSVLFRWKNMLTDSEGKALLNTVLKEGGMG